MTANRGHDRPRARGGRKKLWDEKLNLTLPLGAKARMDALLAEDEDRLDLIRAAIEVELRRREAATTEHKPEIDTSPWTWSAYGFSVSGTAIEMRLTPVAPAVATESPDPRIAPVSRPPPATPAPTTRSKRRSKNNPAPLRHEDPRYNGWTKRKDRVPAWNDFWVFADDVGVRPPGKMLLRRHAGQPHGPTNSYWGTAEQRNRALPRGRKPSRGDHEPSLKQMAAEAGIGYSTFTARLRRGMTREAALNTKVRWGPGRPKRRSDVRSSADRVDPRLR